MKKVTTKDTQTLEDDSMRAEYDFMGGVRGKHYHAMQSGYTVTIHKADGTTLVKEVKPAKGVVMLEPDVRKYFPDSDSVNATLRSLIRLIPTQKKKHGAWMQGYRIRTGRELGPKDVLAGLIRRIDKDARAVSGGDVASVKAFGETVL
jgi:hypothetical protein